MKIITRSLFHDFCHFIGLDADHLERQMEALVDDLRLGDDPDEETFARTHARRTDHSTSHEAAASALPLSPTVRTMVLLYHATRPEPEIDEVAEMFFEAYWNLARSGVRTRRDELVKRGLMEPTGAYGKTTRGRRAVTWRLTPHARGTLARYGVGGPAPEAGDEGMEAGDEGTIVVAATIIAPAQNSIEPVQKPPVEGPPSWETPPLPLSEPPARVVPLDEDAGSIRNWWVREWVKPE